MPVTFTFGEMLSARSVIGTTLAELGKTHDNLWVLTPDIGATLVEFQETFPDRFLDVGLAEQVCVGIAAGLAYDGNIPVVSGMLPFLSMRALEQVRSDVCYPNLPVKIIGTHGGLVGNGGSTHYAVEDLALMCALTNMTVTSIGDPLMVGEILRQSMTHAGPHLHPPRRRQEGQGPLRAGPARRADRQGHHRPRRHRRHDLHARHDGGAGAPGRGGTRRGRPVRAGRRHVHPEADRRGAHRPVRRRDRRPVRGRSRTTSPTAGSPPGSRTSSPTGASGSPPSSGSASPRSTPGFGDDEELRDKHGYGLAATVAATRRVIAAPGLTHPLDQRSTERQMRTVAVTKIGSLRDPDESARGRIGIVELPEQPLGPEDVRVRVAYSAICGSDPHLAEGFFGTDVPIGLGHELSGVVEAVGERHIRTGTPGGRPRSPATSCASAAAADRAGTGSSSSASSSRTTTARAWPRR